MSINLRHLDDQNDKNSGSDNSQKKIDKENKKEFISSRYRVLHTPWCTFFLVWLYLTFTQSHSLLWFDSGELALAGHTLGLGHPPGQPFYTFLAMLTTYFPQSIWWLNQLSAFALALSIIPLWKLMDLISLSPSSVQIQIDEVTNKTGLTDLIRSLGKTVIALSWVLLYPVWDQGTRIEVYSLANLLGLGSLWLLMSAQFSTRQAHRFFWSGICVGLCGATHAIFAVAYTLASLSLAKSVINNKLWFEVLYYLSGMLIGFLFPHLYLVWAIFYSEGFVWGNWQSITDIWRYFSGGDYVNNLHSWGYVLKNLRVYFGWLFEHGSLVWVILSFMGGILSLSWLRTNVIFWWLTCSIFACGIFPFTYQVFWPEVPDFSGYLLPVLSLSLLCVWISFQRLNSTSLQLIFSAFLILSLQSGISNPWSRSRTQHHLPVELSQNWLESLPQNAALFVQSDHWVFPLMYLQQVKKLRSDVLVFNVGFAKSSWYWHWLKKQHPDIPSLAQIQTNRAQRSRLSTLALSRQAVYAETRELADYLALGTPWMNSPSCTSSWGFSVACQAPVSLPYIAQIRRWGAQAKQDQISQKVMARLGLHFVENLWLEQKTEQGLTMGYACLNKVLPAEINLPIRWWPVPPAVWEAAQHSLIGDAVTLEALMLSLSGSSR